MEDETYEDLQRYEDEMYKEQNSSSDSEEDFIKDPSIIYSQIFYTSEKPKFIIEESTTENQKKDSSKLTITNEDLDRKEGKRKEEKTKLNNDNEKKKTEYILISSDSEDEVKPKASTDIKTLATNGSFIEESKYFISRRSTSISIDSINKVFVVDQKYSSDEIELGEIVGKENVVKDKSKIENKSISPSPSPVLSKPISMNNNLKMVTTPLETHIISPIDFKTFNTTPSLKLMNDDELSDSSSSQETSSKLSKISDRFSRESRYKQNTCQNCGSRAHEESVCSSIKYPDNDQNTWRKYKLRSPPRNARITRKSCFRCASREHFGWDCRDYKRSVQTNTLK